MNRQPKGTPVGGEFAEGRHPDGPDLIDASTSRAQVDVVRAIKKLRGGWLLLDSRDSSDELESAVFRLYDLLDEKEGEYPRHLKKSKSDVLTKAVADVQNAWGDIAWDRLEDWAQEFNQRVNHLVDAYSSLIPYIESQDTVVEPIADEEEVVKSGRFAGLRSMFSRTPEVAPQPSTRPPGWYDGDSPTPAEIDAYRSEVEQQKKSGGETPE